MKAKKTTLRAARQKMRKYTGPLQFFHNFEHDSKGRTHCKGPPNNPYEITHVNGGHKITLRQAKGHGRGNSPQWFKMVKRLGDGWDLASGVKIEKDAQ